MIVTSWILLVMFGLISFRYTITWLTNTINEFNKFIFIWFLSIFIVAINAGILFGGLFQ